MGFLNLFKKKEQEQQIESVPQQRNIPQDKVEITGNIISGITIEYYDAHSDFKDFYDTICLQIKDTYPVYIGKDGNIYNALVSWYNNHDCIMVDDNGVEHNFRREATQSIQLGIDLNKLHDMDYMQTLFTSLLKQKRVNEYLLRGLKDNPEIPCGNYVGEVFYNEETGRYAKKFTRNIGLSCHNSPEQVERRNKYKTDIEQSRLNEIRKREEMISKLQSEINDLNR